jgi:hypothetical protein
MKTKHLLLFAAILCSRHGIITPVCAQSTAFTYQGALKSGGTVANGSYDLSFGLYATNSGGSPIIALATNLATGVSNGLFTTTLDFGGIFTGTNYWLEIGARANGSLSGFTILSPRQPMTATPYALHARTAGTKVYGSFRTHAYWGNFGTAGLIFPGGPILFNQNSGLDVTPPSPVVGGITFNNVPDAFIPQISGVTQITVPIAGDYAVTWGHAFQSLGGFERSWQKTGFCWTIHR